MADRITPRRPPKSDELAPDSIESRGDTLSPTATERLLEAGGASVYVLSKDSELVAAITVAGNNKVPVHVIWSFPELRRHVERAECKIVLLDADLFEGSLRRWIEELCALEPTLVMLVAASRQAEWKVTELLSEGLVHRLLIKPATVGITHTLLEAAVSRHQQLSREVVASRNEVEAAHADVTAAASEIPAPLNELLALRQAAARSDPIGAPRRRPVAKSKTYWPAWLLPIALVVTVVVAVFVGDFESVELRGPSAENADAPSEPSFAEPVDAEAPPVDQVIGRPEDAFVSDQTAAPIGAEEALPASPRTEGPPAPEPSTASPPVVGPPSPTPAAVPAATAPPELEGLLAAAWSRVRANRLLAPPGDSARDYVARAVELAPDHPDVIAIRSLLGEAVAESARAALESGDLEGAETLAAEALRLGASDETLAVLDLDLAAAREVSARRAHSDLLELGVARIREDRLIAPGNDNALAYLRRLRAESPNYPGLDSAWQSLGEALASKVEESVAAEDWAGAEAWLEPLAPIASPVTIERLRAELAVKRLEAEYLATPAAQGELQLLTAVDPVYPEDARRRGIAGWVDVEFVLGTDGIPRDAGVVAADPPVTFDQAALAAVSLYRYEPFERDGRAFERLARLRIRFDLR